MKRFFSLSFFLLILLSCSETKEETSFSVGIIADCQYCDCDIKWNRYYKKAPQRLRVAVDSLNKKDLAYTIHLGDFIDQKFSSFDSLVPTWNKLKSPSYHVLGNHDFEVADSLKSKIFEKLNLKIRYYSFEQGNWKFIVLDGNDLSFYGALDSLKMKETEVLFNRIESDSLPYAKPYNGGLSKEQFTWVEKELVDAKNNNQHVGFYCHFPLTPINNGNLWNTNELLELIEKNKHVKLFMNGHKHEGAYDFKNDVHYITFKGMVNTSDSTSFATANFYKDSIQIKGYGREVSRTLKITP